MPDKEEFNFELDPAAMGFEGFGLFGEGMPEAALDDEDAPPWEGEDILFPEATARNQYEPLDPEKMPQIEGVKQDTPEYAARPASERTKELFSYMRPHRVSLMTMLEAAKEPASNAAESSIANQRVIFSSFILLLIFFCLCCLCRAPRGVAFHAPDLLESADTHIIMR